MSLLECTRRVKIATYDSHMINPVAFWEIENDIEFEMLEGVTGIDDMLDGLQTYSFAVRTSNAPWKIEIIRSWENNPNPNENNTNSGLTNILS